MCHTVAPVEALTYLQKDVHAVVDHLSEEETTTFRALHSHLFGTSSLSSLNNLLTNTEPSSSNTPDIHGTEETSTKLSPEVFHERTKVFESLMEFVQADNKEPDKDLIDLLTGSENGEPMLL